MIRSLRRLGIAVAFMTRVPMPNLGQVSADDFAASMRWFPATGLLVGLLVWAAAALGGQVDPWTGALLGTLCWVLATGGLHLDGLADLSDAMGAAHGDRDRFVAVLEDSRVGSFGVLAIVLQIVAKLVLLRLMMERDLLMLLPALAMVARVGPLAWTRWLPPLKAGLGARFVDVVRIRDLALWALAVLGAAAAAPPLALGLLPIAAWWAYLRLRVGGVSGDCHGAGIELVETALLLLIAAAG
jgi:adenosylcobinamide-GDP ribazoletransferase